MQILRIYQKLHWLINLVLQVAKQLFHQLFLKTHFPTKFFNCSHLHRNKIYNICHFEKCFMGYTDYLDGIYVEDLDDINPNKSIFMGVDKYNRSFISLKLDIVIGKQMIQDVLDNVTQIPNQQEFMDLVRNNNVKVTFFGL